VEEFIRLAAAEVQAPTALPASQAANAELVLGHGNLGGVMIWKPERFRKQGQLVADLYRLAAGVPCERMAVLAGGHCDLRRSR
jgi:hypothetical protein